MVEFNTVELYGGAITAELPATFADVSEIRQVPDNQEVYLDVNGFTSIVFDVLERVDKPDKEAFDFHFGDILEDDNTYHIWISETVTFLRLPQSTPAYSLWATTTSTQLRAPGRSEESSYIGLLFTMLRLEQQNTDIIITINVPHIPKPSGNDEIASQHAQEDPLATAAMHYREKILETFEIKDWDLFVQE